MHAYELCNVKRMKNMKGNIRYMHLKDDQGKLVHCLWYESQASYTAQL